MAPPKRTQQPAKENISLGPQVREGKILQISKYLPMRRFIAKTRRLTPHR